MNGENFVRLKGFLKYPELKYFDSGACKFSGKVAVPISYRKNGEEKNTQMFYKISAWSDIAESMSELVEDTPIEIHGHINERKWDAKCKNCGEVEKKYWTDVQVDNFIIIDEE